MKTETTTMNIEIKKLAKIYLCNMVDFFLSFSLVGS